MSRILSDLLSEGLVERVPVLLGPRDQAYRQLFWTRDVCEWLYQHRNLTTRSLATIPEQANQAFADFIVGRPMIGMTKCDPPKASGVWRLKTPDLRFYGWAPGSQTLVIVAAELKRELLKPGPPRDKDLGRRVMTIRKEFGITAWINGEIFNVFPRAPS